MAVLFEAHFSARIEDHRYFHSNGALYVFPWSSWSVRRQIQRPCKPYRTDRYGWNFSRFAGHSSRSSCRVLARESRRILAKKEEGPPRMNNAARLRLLELSSVEFFSQNREYRRYSSVRTVRNLRVHRPFAPFCLCSIGNG